jgi:hypothetical protein
VPSADPLTGVKVKARVESLVPYPGAVSIDLIASYFPKSAALFDSPVGGMCFPLVDRVHIDRGKCYLKICVRMPGFNFVIVWRAAHFHDGKSGNKRLNIWMKSKVPYICLKSENF